VNRVSTVICRSPNSLGLLDHTELLHVDYSWSQDCGEELPVGAMPLTDLGRRVLANVVADRGDWAVSTMTGPAEQ
jgi:hypothetical protein